MCLSLMLMPLDDLWKPILACWAGVISGAVDHGTYCSTSWGMNELTNEKSGRMGVVYASCPLSVVCCPGTQEQSGCTVLHYEKESKRRSK